MGVEMMDDRLQLTYERNHNHTYLVYEGEIQEQDYVMQMMLNNDIAGLLQCRFDKVDGRGRLYYEISSRQPMTSVFEKKKINYDILKKLFQSLRDVFVRMEEFLLPEQYLMFYPELIYMEPEQNIFYFCLVPDVDKEDGMHKLLEYLLERIDYADEKAVAAAYEWYKKAGEENYSFDAIYQQVFGEKRSGKQNSQKQIQVEACDRDDREVRKEAGVTGTQQFFSEKVEKTDGIKEKKRKSVEEPVNNMDSVRSVLPSIIGVAAVLVVLALAGIYFGWIHVGIEVVACVILIAVVGGYLFYRTKSQEEEDTMIWEDEEFLGHGERIEDTESIDEEEWNVQPRMKQEERPLYEVQESGESDFNSNSVYGATVFMSNEQIQEGRRLKPMGGNFPVLGIELFPYIIGKLVGAVDGVVEHETVSRIHCKIEFEDGEYYIRDLNSTNGTVVNGTVVGAGERMQIYSGDEIQIGQALYMFE